MPADLESELARLVTLARNDTISPRGLYLEVARLSVGHSRKGQLIGPRQLDVHRTRTLSGTAKPRMVKELSYPPLKFNQLGRANAVGQRMFYGSLGFSTTLAETRTDAGQTIVTGRWTNTEELAVHRLGLDEPDNPLEKFYRELFCEPGPGLYKYSAEIARQFCTGDIAGILYPSVILGDTSTNIAIKKDRADSGLRFVEATCVYVVEGTPGREYRFAQTDYARSEGRRLRWRGHGKQWTLRRQGEVLHMHSDGIDWIATDEDGNRRHPD